MLLVVAFLKPAVTSAGTLTTLFASDGGLAGNTFDIEVTRRAGVAIRRFDINIDPRAVFHEIHIYWREGPSVGHEESPDGWSLMGVDDTVNSLGRDRATPVAVISPPLAPGLYGIYVDTFSYIDNSEQFRFTSGSGIYANTDLRIITNTGQGTPAFLGVSVPHQQWNGTIHYTVLPEPPTVVVLLLACCGAAWRGRRLTDMSLSSCRRVQESGHVQ